ncbi:MAG: type II toxin-antitoxin system VapC family toxin [Rhizobiales bacterium]|nr:type II toxin-antitoxin system VapC family toxin [Hyphomicrobiales bacterium]
MVIDSSAVLAILQREPESAPFAALIEADPVRLISAVSVLETGMIAEVRKGEAGALELDNFLLRGQVQTVPFDAEQAAIARKVFPAGLNFGDCAAYALASTRGEPLLFKGQDFSRTDIARAAG